MNYTIVMLRFPGSHISLKLISITLPGSQDMSKMNEITLDTIKKII